MNVAGPHAHTLITFINMPCRAACVGERTRKACRNYNIRVVFRSGLNLLSMLIEVKDPLLVKKQANVVYKVPCT